jgi:tRNA-specific 2-thiouridylase
LGEPRYVSTIDAQTNVITLGRREDLYRDEFSMEGVSFVAGEPPNDDFTTHIRIRHRATPVPGSVSRHGDGWTVRLDAPAWAPAPGQAAVFYDGEEVVGGGRIASA